MDAVKLVDVEQGIIEGWAIPFGGPMPGGKDLEGEAFTPETQLFMDNYTIRPLKYHHGKDTTLGHHKIGVDVKATRKERGIWLEAQIDVGHQYAKVLKELLGAGWLGFSSGAMPGTVAKTSDGIITSWEWIETSLTPTPANPFAMIAAKSVLTEDPSANKSHHQCPAPVAMGARVPVRISPNPPMDRDGRREDSGRG